MAGWAAWSPVKERDKLGVVTYNYQVQIRDMIRSDMKKRWLPKNPEDV